MSIYKNGKLIAGGRQCAPLLSFMWADHVLNDASWLRADTFSWQSGAVYQAAYQHLLQDLEELVFCWIWKKADSSSGYTAHRNPVVGDSVYSDQSLTTEIGTITAIGSNSITVSGDVYDFYGWGMSQPETETIAGITIQFFRASDGHKICLMNQESNVTAIYNATGVAWYYIIDATNQRFKLPRTKFGFTGIRSGVGKYVAAGLPNITAKVQFTGDTNAVAGGGAAYATADSRSHDQGGGTGIYSPSSVLIDASEQNAIYGNSDTVQPKATEMYLYFYVGNFTQTALENTAGINTELFNGKADTDFSNVNNTGKAESVSWGRQFTNVGSVIAIGNVNIAGTYTLGFTDNKVKIGIFECCLLTTQSGFSNIALASDVSTTPTNVAGTNNQFRSDGTIIIPFINSITISFPSTSAGIGSGTSVKFIGWM